MSKQVATLRQRITRAGACVALLAGLSDPRTVMAAGSNVPATTRAPSTARFT